MNFNDYLMTYVSMSNYTKDEQNNLYVSGKFNGNFNLEMLNRGNPVKDNVLTLSNVDFKYRSYKDKLVFLREFFEKNGSISVSGNNIKCTLRTVNKKLLDNLSIMSKRFKHITEDDTLSWFNVNAIDFLGYLYINNNLPVIESEFKKTFYNFLKRDETRLPKFVYSKTEFAYPPEKSRTSDTGYDLTLIKKIKEKGGVYYYDTGITVKPDCGYYFDLVGRSSISKTGWMLANNIGIIDQSYRGSIIVALVRIRDDAPELKLPSRMVQLVPRKVVLMEMNQVDNVNSDETNRSCDGGIVRNLKRGWSAMTFWKYLTDE